MAGNHRTRLEAALAQVEGTLVGSNLLSKLKEKMLTQTVLKTLFGNAGERIFINQSPNYNESIVPALELTWESEIGRSADVYHPGTIKGMIVLPAKFKADVNQQRLIGAVFQRFLESKACNLFGDVAGLTKFGYETSYRYDRLLHNSGWDGPVIEMSIPVLFDMRLFQRSLENWDILADLDAGELGLMETYLIALFSEEGDELIAQGVLSETGEENPD